MSIKVVEDARQHPARDVAIQSMKAAMERDRDAWLAIWDDDGIVQDPIGPSPLDPSGEGHRGKQALAAFYDKFIGSGELRFQIRQTFACGNECANVGTITTKMPGGQVSRTELVITYRITDDGKLAALRAYWEFADTAASIF